MVGEGGDEAAQKGRAGGWGAGFQPQDLPRFVKGERVYHDTFGSGTVGEVSGFGRDLKVAVHFETVGSKRLLVRYAGLRRDFD